jgi:hypothetical protein
MLASLRPWALLTLLCALATVLVAWWALPIVVAGWTLARPRHGGVLQAALAAATAWAAILLWSSRSGPVGAMATLLGDLLGTTGPAVLGLTLGYGALLAGGAALLARAIIPPPARRGT